MRVAEVLMAENDVLTIAGKSFTSRLFLGTGKFSNNDLMASAIEASGTELVTVALRRVDAKASVEDDFQEL